MTVPSPDLVPTLEFAAHVDVALGAPIELGSVPTGTRRIIPIVGGVISGPLLNGEIRDGGADWQIVAPDGTAVIDTRYGAVTSDGHALYIATEGFRHGTADDIYFRLTVRLECGAAELAWVNRTVFVGSALRHASQVEYDLFAVR